MIPRMRNGCPAVIGEPSVATDEPPPVSSDRACRRASCHLSVHSPVSYNPAAARAETVMPLIIAELSP